MAKKNTTTKSSSTKKSASSKAKASTKSRNSNKKASSKSAKTDEKEVTIDRRRNDDNESKPKVERRQKVQRRRQIDPTTCERDYSVQEVEFMNALDEYKRTSGRMFPTCSEVLEVIRNLGYVQLSPAELAARTPIEPTEEQVSEESEASEVAEQGEFELAGQVEAAY